MKVSIISGAYNVENTIKDSVDSILNQTFQDWEFIICDDGSNDGTYNILKDYKEKFPNKFVILKNLENKGLNETLNTCLKYVKGEYVARHDLDDISHKDRLKKQVKFLDENPKYAMVGTNMEYADKKEVWGRTNLITEPQKKDFIKGSPFCHATMMIKKQVLKDVEGYATHKYALRVEDYDLWFRIYEKRYMGYNLHEYLYTMQDDRNAYKRRKYKYRINESVTMFKGFCRLKVDYKYYPVVLKPLLVGLIPYYLYKKIREIVYNS